MQRTSRMKRELAMLERDPPPGISCWAKGDDLTHLEAQILGGERTPYADGIFKLEIHIPDRYPFEPPKVQYITPIYHPNIDTSGRICLDLLKMPPAGNWKPSLNISTVLTSLQLLMAEPNPDDPLMADISTEFKHNRVLFLRKAKQWTLDHAMSSAALISGKVPVDDSKESEDSDSDSDSSSSDGDDENETPRNLKSANQNGPDTTVANPKASSMKTVVEEKQAANEARGEKRCLKEANELVNTVKRSNVMT